MTLRSAAKTLLALALGLPIVQLVLFWVGGLLASMGDRDGARIIQYIGTACQVLWAVSAIGLVIAVALVVLNEPPRDSGAPREVDDSLHE